MTCAFYELDSVGKRVVHNLFNEEKTFKEYSLKRY